jgi:Rrf2 family iron-sulfur cluster assembly transcriptional regulator
MELLRRKTDYAMRIMTKLGRAKKQGPVATKELAETGGISFQLASKLMQKLQKSKYVNSHQGRAGGFELGKEADQISLLEIIETIQGPLALNKCLLDDFECGRESDCAVYKKLNELQQHIKNYLSNISLADLLTDASCSQKK